MVQTTDMRTRSTPALHISIVRPRPEKAKVTDREASVKKAMAKYSMFGLGSTSDPNWMEQSTRSTKSSVSDAVTKSPKNVVISLRRNSRPQPDCDVPRVRHASVCTSPRVTAARTTVSNAAPPHRLRLASVVSNPRYSKCQSETYTSPRGSRPALASPTKCNMASPRRSTAKPSNSNSKRVESAAANAKPTPRYKLKRPPPLRIPARQTVDTSATTAAMTEVVTKVQRAPKPIISDEHQEHIQQQKSTELKHRRDRIAERQAQNKISVERINPGWMPFADSQNTWIKESRPGAYSGNVWKVNPLIDTWTIQADPKKALLAEPAILGRMGQREESYRYAQPRIYTNTELNFGLWSAPIMA